MSRGFPECANCGHKRHRVINSVRICAGCGYPEPAGRDGGEPGADEAAFDQRNYHALVTRHARAKFLRGEYTGSVKEAYLALEGLVQEKSGAEDDGIRLMKRAFEGKRALEVPLPGTRSKTRRNVQRGLMYMCMGIVSGVRNPVAHEPEHKFPIDCDAALEILGVISYLCGQIDKTGKVLDDDGTVSRDRDDARADLAESERLLSRNPDDGDALLLKGDALCALGRHEEAIPELEQAVRLDPDSPEAHAELGWALFDGERDADALRSFDIAVSLDPSDPDPHMGRGMVLLSAGRHADALSAFDRAVEIDPYDPEGHDCRATALAELGRHEEARRALVRSIRADPSRAISHVDMAFVLYRMNDIARALQSCNRAISLDSRLADAYAVRAAILRRLERHDIAISDCDHALSLDPNSPDALYGRGLARLGLGRLKEALDDLDLACKLDPKSTAFHKTRGDTLHALGRPEEALEAYGKVLGMAPDDSRARMARVAIFLERGKRASALSACQSLLKRHPDDSGVRLHMGLVYRELGRHEEALAEFKAAARLDPGGMYPKAYTISTLIELGRIGDLLELAAVEIRAHPGEAGPRWLRASSLHALGRHKDALAEINRAIGLNPAIVGCRLAKGAILAKLGRGGEASAEHSLALEMLDTAIAKSPHDGAAHMMRGMALYALGREGEAKRAQGLAMRLEPVLGPVTRDMPKGVPWPVRAPRGQDPKAVISAAAYSLARQDYSGFLDLLEEQPPEILGETRVVEGQLLSMLRDIRLRHRPDREFAAEIGPHEPRIMALMEAVRRAKSLDVEPNRSMDKYRSLVDYVSRVWEGHESMLENPGFWPWLDGNYEHVSAFLRANDRCVSKTNSLVQTLSLHFRLRDSPHVRAYMGAVDGLCRQVMEIRPGSACDYARKAGESWISAETEMAVLVAIGRHFEAGQIDPEIPGSSRLADMTFVHDGVEHYVEVYSHAEYHSAFPETRMDISPEEEWSARFGKAQIAVLQKAGVPTVYVMALNDFQAQPGATRTRAFCEAARKAMPSDSDIVVILHGVEVASLRGGRVVEPSGIAKILPKAIWEAMPENVAHLGL